MTSIGLNTFNTLLDPYARLTSPLPGQIIASDSLNTTDGSAPIPYTGSGTAPTASTEPTSGFEQLPSYADLFNQWSNTLNQNPVNITPYDPRAEINSLVNNIQPIQGLDPAFFESQRSAMKDALREEFFGPLGTFQQQASNESAAGRLGSGVSSRILENTVTNPYAKAMVDIDRNIMQSQLQENARVETMNAQLDQYKTSLQANGINLFSQNSQQAEIAEAQINQARDQLAGSLAMAERGLLSQEEMFQVTSQFQIMQAQFAMMEKAYNDLVTIATTPVNPEAFIGEQIDKMIQEGWSKEQIDEWVEMIGHYYPAFKRAPENEANFQWNY